MSVLGLFVESLLNGIESLSCVPIIMLRFVSKLSSSVGSVSRCVTAVRKEDCDNAHRPVLVSFIMVALNKYCDFMWFSNFS